MEISYNIHTNKQAIQPQFQRRTHYSLVHGALYSKIRRFACVFGADFQKSTVLASLCPMHTIAWCMVSTVKYAAYLVRIFKVLFWNFW
jgi:hypothetical protein